MNEDQIDLHARLETLLKGAGIIAAVVAYFATPMFPYVNADWLLSCGSFITIGAAVAIMLSSSNNRVVRAIAVLACFAPMVWLAIVTTAASRDYNINQARCLKLEVDMLSGRNAIPNAPDVFQAMRCIPQAAASNEIIAGMKK